MQFSVQKVRATDSTNDDLWELVAKGAPEGTAVRALRQNAGRGQWGRVWMSPEGGLYFSVLLCPRMPESCWARLSPALAGAVAGVVREECGLDEERVWVKCPNDVVCDQGKLCGISLDARRGCVVVGCGVNVFHADRPIETDGRNVPAYMCDLGLAELPSVAYLDALMEKLLAAMGAALEEMEQSVE